MFSGNRIYFHCTMKIIITLCLMFTFSKCEESLQLSIEEESDVGTVLGTINQRPFTVNMESTVNRLINVNQQTGTISVKSRIDREEINDFRFYAIPSTGSPIIVYITVLDINDNPPVFPNRYISVNVSESITDGFQHSLGTANDPDSPPNSIDHFEIVSGNVNDIFFLESEIRNGRLYPDLKVRHELNYEETSMYSLLIRAFDGGSPPKFGDLRVNITVEDVNDNQPTFDPTQYVAMVPENASIGASVLQVYATDIEEGENGRITYELDRRKPSSSDFRIDEETGILRVNRQLDFENLTGYELIIVARDHGEPPLQSTAVVTISIDNINDNAPEIEVHYLNDESPGRISEDAEHGSFIAIISVSDRDMPLNPQVNVALEGDRENFDLIVVDNIMYLRINTSDRELQQVYHLTITATDFGSPRLSARKHITLYISDTNDNPPVFRSSSYRAEIEETAPIGSSVIQVTAVDQDEGENSVITYHILLTPASYSNWFQIDNFTGLITTQRRIDCETQSSPMLTVIAQDSGIPPQSATTTVEITIQNVNDNPPLFEQSLYIADIKENITAGTCILTVVATDEDCGHSETIAYTLLSATPELTMRAHSGELCVSAQLDYERRRVYELEVAATDQDGLSSTAYIKVNVGDVNDNLPQFYPTRYNVNLARSSPPHTEVVVVQASDQDEGPFGELSYEIVSGNSGGLFYINPQSGVIRLAQSLPASGTTSVTLRVAAIDGDGRRSAVDATVAISLLDAAHNLPNFTSALYSFAVPENASVHTLVGTVEARVQSGTVQYSIQSGDQNQLLEIDSASGQVRVGSSLDHDLLPFVLLNIEAAAGSPPRYGQAQVNITILDVNDNSPVFGDDSQEIMVRENHTVDTVVYTASASDRDSGDNGAVVYALAARSDPRFSVDSQSGAVTLRQALDFETQRSHVVRVVAADQGAPSRSATLNLTVQVQDVNDNPPRFLQQRYNVTVAENVAINTRFASASATDSDSGQNARVVYSLVTGAHSQTFGIFPNDGSIYNKVNLDRESVARYTLVVIARDEGLPSLSSTATVDIRVTDVNDNAPTFRETAYTFYVPENEPSDSTVGFVSAIDPDENPQGLRYLLSQPSNVIAVDSGTGRLSTRTPLDREISEQLSVVVAVTDSGSPPRTTPVQIIVNVLDKNDNNPVFDRNVYSVKIEENEAKNTLVVVVTATDRDNLENGTITYRLDNSSGDLTNHFYINAQTGHILLQERLDYEQRSQFVLRVLARDQGTDARQGSALVNVTLMDHNEARPEFNSTQLSITIRENVALGTVVGRVVAQDADRHDSIIYYIIAGNALGTFALNASKGDIVVARPVDYEESSYHTITVRALDNNPTNPKSSIMNVNITVLDVNDNPPVFENDPIFVSIRENIPMGTTAHTLSAIDLDSGSAGQVRYEIVTQTPDRQWFRIDAQSGALMSVSEVDYEQVELISLVVRATDKPTNASQALHSTVTVLVMVENKNDNSPVFTSPTSVSVLEDEPIGYPIMYVIATDADAGPAGDLNYIIAQGNDLGHFQINQATGLLTVAKALDRETAGEFSLRVTARDNGSPRESASTDLVISVVDVNDNRPQFQRSAYTAQVYEDALPGTLLLNLTATDRDADRNAELTFLIPEGIVGDLFTIGARTGEVRTNGTLDREQHSSYVLTAYVRDGAFPALYDTCTVTILVLDRNDNEPELSDSTYALRVHENTRMPALYTVVAADPDLGDNGLVRYAITGGNSEGRFSIDASSGQISCQPLDRERRSAYNLTIEARDSGSPALSRVMALYIEVLDENDNSPEFDAPQYTESVLESLELGSPVLTVRAQDADFGDNARITYSIATADGWVFGPFKIDNGTGEITTTGSLDRERQSVYRFSVQATDGSQFNPRSTSTSVNVTVLDVNDNAPVFTAIPYVAAIPQSTAVGASVLAVSATDADVGAGGSVRYSLEGESRYFMLGTTDGVVRVARLLDSDALTLHRLQVRASDQGQHALTSNGVVEVTVGGGGGEGLVFASAAYNATLSEAAVSGTQVVTVRATGAAQVSYNFVSGNQPAAFNINSATGAISVGTAGVLDYESAPSLRLIVEATGGGGQRAYTTVNVRLTDANDNPPQFSQDRYSTVVYEELDRHTFVTQLLATDADSQLNGRVFYEIINPGDVGNAFKIEPAHTGIVLTNVVLDAETKRDYRLIVRAYDAGNPSLSSTCTLKIQVIDVNDNVPYFSPQPPVSVNEGVPVGTVVTTVTATDTDVNHQLNYYFAEGGNPGSMFTLDAYNGRVTVARPLDYEQRTQYNLMITVSDTNNTAVTPLSVNIVDINDNPPVFTRTSFQVTVDEDTGPGVSVLTVTATDRDAGDNARIRYSMFAVAGFQIDPDTGTISTNRTVVYSRQQPVVPLVVTATDHGAQPFTAVVPVQVQVRDINNNAPTFLESGRYTGRVSEDEVEGLIVVHAAAEDADDSPDNRKIEYTIMSGNTNNTFQIKNDNGDIYLVGALDREQTPAYSLVIQARDRGVPALSSTASVYIAVDDVNDNAPRFNASEYRVELREDAPRYTELLRVVATDRDQGINGRVQYTITSGNDYQNFAIDRDSGVVSVISDGLDYETRPVHHLTVMASDMSIDFPRQSSFVTVRVNVTDVNEYTPRFPVMMYIEAVREREPIGTVVFTAKAADLDLGPFGVLIYEITAPNSNFAIDAETGIVRTLRVFNYTRDAPSDFHVRARDRGDRYSEVPVIIQIDPNFVPVFAQPTYHFEVRGDQKAGSVIGQVEVQNIPQTNNRSAVVEFSFKEPHQYFEINEYTGVIRVTRDLLSEADSTVRRRREVAIRSRRALEEDSVRLVVVASVGYPRLTQEVEIVIAVDHTCEGCGPRRPQPNNGNESTGIAGTYVVIIVVFVVMAVILGVVILALFVRGRTQRKKKADSHFTSFNSVDSMPASGEFPPPSYDDAYGNGRALTDTPGTGSSGRGSVDLEDDEIRMINATPLHGQETARLPPDSGMQDDDALSEQSAKDHHEYLARLGIDTAKLKMNGDNKAQSVESMHHFSDEGGGEGTLDNYHYNTMPQEGMAVLDPSENQFAFQEASAQSTGGSLSSVINSEEEFSGSYNWGYLLDWGPQYQPLADVFTEIARLKDDSIKPKKAPTKIVPQSCSGFQNQQLRASYPPPIITDAPPKGIEMVAGSGSVAANGGHSSHGGQHHHPHYRERKDSSSSNRTVNSTRTSQLTSLSNLPKSPMSYESSFTTTPLSPDFENSLSPLQQHSPSYSPIVTPGVGSAAHSTGHNTPRRQGAPCAAAQHGSEQEIRI